MDRYIFIQQELNNGTSLEKIGKALGISKQRVYQIIHEIGLKTPERRRHGYRTVSPKMYWLCTNLMKTTKSKKLTKEEREILIQFLKDQLPDFCPILGLKLEYSKGSRKDHELSPSIDRIDPSKGYVVGNVHVISWRANRLKSNGSPEELRKIADYIDHLTL